MYTYKTTLRVIRRFGGEGGRVGDERPIEIRSPSFRDPLIIFSEVLSRADQHLIHILSTTYQAASKTCSKLIVISH